MNIFNVWVIQLPSHQHIFTVSPSLILSWLYPAVRCIFQSRTGSLEGRVGLWCRKVDINNVIVLCPLLSRGGRGQASSCCWERERQSAFNLQDWLTSHYNQTHRHKFMYKCTGPHADICMQHTLSHSRGGSVIMPCRSSQAYLPSSCNQFYLCIYFQTVFKE